MNKLFICRTPMQIIIAICIKKQFFNKKDITDLIIMNTFNNYDVISEKIKELKIFNNVYNAEFIKKKSKKLDFVFNTNKYFKNIILKDNNFYDELYFWNYDFYTASLRAYLYKKNKNIKTFLFEEAYTMYFPYKDLNKEQLFFKLITLKNKIFHHNLTRDNIDGLFMLEPKLLLYKPKCPVFKIDSKIIKSKNVKDIILKIFNVNNAINKYDKKYIFLEDGREEYNDDLVIDNLIKKVGKENIIVKSHPRRNPDRFIKKGLKVLGNDGIPWEALVMAGDFSKKIIITISSSSVISQRLLLGKSSNAFLLFKAFHLPVKEFNGDYVKFWDNLESSDINSGIHIPKTFEEFYNIIDKIEGKN